MREEYARPYLGGNLPCRVGSAEESAQGGRDRVREPAQRRSEAVEEPRGLGRPPQEE